MSETPAPLLYRVAARTELRAGPGPTHETIRTLDADQILRLVGSGTEGWLEVETNSGHVGFAPAGLLRKQASGAKPPQHSSEAFPWRNPDRVNRDPKMLHPAFRGRALRTVARLNAEGIPFGIFEGMRGPWRQAHLYAQGRGRGHRIVTQNQPWQSLHNYGLAADFVLALEGRWSWDDDGPMEHWWDRLFAVARDEGLEPGMAERPHFQLAGVSIEDLRAGRLPPGGDVTWQTAYSWLVSSWDGKPSAPPLK